MAGEPGGNARIRAGRHPLRRQPGRRAAAARRRRGAGERAGRRGTRARRSRLAPAVSSPPLPLAVREHRLGLDGPWEVELEADAKPQPIVVPYTFESELSGIGL